MAIGRLVTIACFFAALFFSAARADAQNAPLVREGMHVWVTLADGPVLEGDVSSIAGSEIVLRTDGAARPLALSSVRRIEGRDSRWNGTRNGAIVGAAVLGGFGAFLSYALCDVPDCLKGDIGPLLLLAGMGAGAGAAAGALIDHAIDGRRVLYSSQLQAMTIEVSPSLTLQSVGVRVRARF